MSNKTRRISAIIAAFFAVLMAILIVLWLSHSPYPCRALPFAYDYLCFAQNVDYVYKAEGSEAAFVYLDSLPNDLNYGASHLIAHQLGHALFEDTQNVQAALGEVPYKDYSATELFRYGGVVHGIFHSYFLFGSETQDVHTLIDQSCAGLPEEQQGLLLSDCAHGVGHGLMAYTNNDIKQTLLLCKESIQPENCIKGAFMERGLLYIPGYADIAHMEEMEDICPSLESQEKVLCAEYSGWMAIVKDLVQKHTSNTAQALQACASYDDNMSYSCVFVASRDLFSIVYDNNADAMVQACDALPEDREACLQGLDEWKQWDEAYRGADAKR